MLLEIFYWVLNMSIIGGLTGLIVALLRKIPGFPRFAAYFLWILPLIRLWVPFGMASRWSLLSLISRYATKTVLIWERSPGPDFSMTNSIQAAESYFPIVYKSNLLDNIFDVASVIWAIIAMAAILVSLLLYAAAMRELRDARHLRDNIWISGKIVSPAVYGILRPRIVTPPWIADKDMPFILAHERVHIRRRDNLWRAVAVITACIHWFNPLSWIFLRWFFSDMELACDVKALKALGGEKARDYAAVLLACASGKCNFSSAFGGLKTRMRIDGILSNKKLTLLSTLAFGALIASVAFVLITNATGGL
ncbi:MAG: peptidase M56 BlaR1 [Clostridia bacterium]|nr:peptidase M56 BlaR1 [Clostridia bacterium]